MYTPSRLIQEGSPFLAQECAPRTSPQPTARQSSGPRPAGAKGTQGVLSQLLQKKRAANDAEQETGNRHGIPHHQFETLATRKDQGCYADALALMEHYASACSERAARVSQNVGR